MAIMDHLDQTKITTWCAFTLKLLNESLSNLNMFVLNSSYNRKSGDTVGNDLEAGDLGLFGSFKIDWHNWCI